MKVILVIVGILYIPQVVFAQSNKEVLKLYERNNQTNDTVRFCTIIKGSKGYTFAFPERVDITYRLKDSVKIAYDTIKEKFSASYGPYVFVKRKDKIMFKDLSRSPKLFDLYNIGYEKFHAPDLFSTSTDSYNIATTLLDSNCIIFSESKAIKCYKYLQVIEGRFDNVYRVIYVGKENILPYRMEYYNDKELKRLLSEIFVMRV